MKWFIINRSLHVASQEQPRCYLRAVYSANESRKDCPATHYSVKLNLAKEAKFDNKSYCEREVISELGNETSADGLLLVKH